MNQPPSSGERTSAERAPVRVTVWSENRHEKRDEKVAGLYPQGMHGAVKEGIEENLGSRVKPACLWRC